MNIFGCVFYVWKLGYYFWTKILENIVSRPKSFWGSMVLNDTKEPTYPGDYNSLSKNSIVLNVMNFSLDSNVFSFGNMSLPLFAHLAKQTTPWELENSKSRSCEYNPTKGSTSNTAEKMVADQGSQLIPNEKVISIAEGHLGVFHPRLYPVTEHCHAGFGDARSLHQHLSPWPLPFPLHRSREGVQEYEEILVPNTLGVSFFQSPPNPMPIGP